MRFSKVKLFWDYFVELTDVESPLSSDCKQVVFGLVRKVQHTSTYAVQWNGSHVFADRCPLLTCRATLHGAFREARRAGVKRAAQTSQFHTLTLVFHLQPVLLLLLVEMLMSDSLLS